MAQGFYWSANSPFIQKFWLRVRRAPRAPALGDVESGFINLAGTSMRNANPAYMIYEILTNTMWGMGAPVSEMNTASFSACAQTLRDEQFGLFMLWTNQDTIENFVQEILDHIQAVLFLSPITGQWTLTLLRADYAAADLPSYTVNDATFTDFARKLPGETINEIVVKWTNPATEKDETVGAQDLANIVAQGGQVVSQDRNYYGVRSGALAAFLAARDLRTVVAPLAKCTMRVSRKGWAETPGGCVKVTIPDEGEVDLVMRVQSVDYGDRSDAYIKVVLLEDIFAYDSPAFTGSGSTAQPSTALAPNPPAYVKAFTMPAFLVANASDTFNEQPTEPEVVAGILVGDTNPDFLNVEPYTSVTLANGTVVQQSIGTRDRVGLWLSDALAAEASTTLAAFPGLVGPAPRLAGFAFIGAIGDDASEIALVQAIDETGKYTLARGVLDTVPRAWAAGTPVWFLSSERYIDTTFRAMGETVSCRPLMRTSVSLLPYANGVDTTITLSDRPYLPSRPANVQVNGQGFGTVALNGADAAVTWANRNRVMETGQILGWMSGSVTPEAGQTTTVEVLDGMGAVTHAYAGLTGTSYSVPAADLAGAATIRVVAVKDGDRSLQAYQLTVTP